MDAFKAAGLVNDCQFRPGWRFFSTPLNGHELALFVEIDTVNTDRDKAQRGYPELITIAPSTLLEVGDCTTEEDVYRVLFDGLQKIDQHEAREFFRVGNNLDAPFHPHRPEGRDAWARTERVTQNA